MSDLDEVRRAARTLEKARAALARAQETHDDAIRAALADRWSGPEVAEAAGISTQRVYQIRDHRR